MKFDCFYKVTVTTCVPESINFFEDEEIYYWGYYPYNIVMKDVKQHYKDDINTLYKAIVKIYIYIYIYINNI